MNVQVTPRPAVTQGADDDMNDGWVSSGKIRARITTDGALELTCTGLTTQTKYYKTLLREFFRKTFPRLRPGYGDYSVHIVMEHFGEAPWMDLDNLAKALLDSLTGNVFEDDHQVARLLVERRPGTRDGIWMLAAAIQAAPEGGPDAYRM
jgi:crossover junction endodeoxyribonuclease RusA